MPTVQAILDEHGDGLVKLDVSAKVQEAARLMAEKHVGAVVVTREGRLAGIFTERDLLTRVVARRKAPQDVTVEGVMTSPVACCSPETTRAECRAIMRAKRIRHLPVVSNDRLLGMVSVRDILEDVAAEQEEEIRHLYEYMHSAR